MYLMQVNMLHLNEASVNAEEGIVFPNISDFGVGTNWQDEVLVDAPIVNHSVTASGGSEILLTMFQLVILVKTVWLQVEKSPSSTGQILQQM